MTEKNFEKSCSFNFQMEKFSEQENSAVNTLFWIFLLWIYLFLTRITKMFLMLLTQFYIHLPWVDVVVLEISVFLEVGPVPVLPSKIGFLKGIFWACLSKKIGILFLAILLSRFSALKLHLLSWPTIYLLLEVEETYLLE